MTPIQAILFDLDGTLVDTAPDFLRICNQLLKAEGRPAIDSAQLRLTVSNGGRAVIEGAFGFKDDHPDFERLLEQMLSLYEASPAQDSRLFAGFDEMLAWLDEIDIPWGIVTNKPARFTHKLIQQLMLDTRCAVTICPDDVSRSKPDPEGLLLACKRIDRLPANTLYIGDHLRDIQAGQAAGMRTLAAAFGYLGPNDQPEFWRSDFCIQESTQLLPLLKSLIQPH
ncbi:HAD family hydrolase [Nitrincola iocasae]|uniref:HAD-IA family hydrolase n=1 Tax=Nitrincola iocasae TaxID=2614693 RepID=A0A5J6LAV9_9GAMM|nr:HAD-IA family hydrolase [Nitrincola iocasae]QEW05683.1 HAD-IA family hydrolase [Nitrincola iocasae]